MGAENVMIGSVSLGKIDDNLVPLTCVILVKSGFCDSLIT